MYTRQSFKIWMFGLFLLVMINKGKGQKNPLGEVQISAPTAASLGKYADFPVSYHTGTPQINIPLYTVKSGPLELPIGLSYHSSGLKVQEAASWVGAGWSLNAGGVITRSVVGLPDDKGFPVGSNQTLFGHWTDYGYSSYLSNSVGGNGVMDDRGFYENRNDGEPDMYFFNFAGYSGKFYFRDDRTPVLVPEQDIKIIPDFGALSSYSSSGNVFRGFTIVTPDGVHYNFGATANAGSINPVEITSPYTLDNGLSNGSAVSSWYLNSIVSKDNQFRIDLSYQNEKYSCYTLSMFPLNSTTTYGSGGTNYEYKPIKNFIEGVRLSQISFPNGQVNLIANNLRSDVSAFSPQNMYDYANTEAKSLSSVQITNNNQFCKQYNFSYGYFHDGTTGLNGQLYNWLNMYNIQSDTYRLRLDAVQEQSCDNSVSTPPYQFTYYSEMVPRLLSFGIDHWGFYNGVTTNSKLIPTYTINGSTTVNGADRDAHWPAMRGGSLQQINYPTGGYTQFTFEPHDTYKTYTSYSNQSRATASVEYDGSSYNTTSFTTGSYSSAFTLTLSSTTVGVGGTLQIVAPNGTVVYTYYATEGGTANYTINLNASTTYTLSLYGYKNTSNWGGCSATVYELVQTTNQMNMTVGGLRIQQMTHHDPVMNQDIVTNYTYYSGTQSSGILYSLPYYVSILRNDNYGNIWGNCPSNYSNPNGCATVVGGGLQAAYLISPNSVRPMTTSQGNHIGYNEVHVTQSGNGSSIYRYYGSSIWDPLQSYGDVAIRNVNTNSCDGTVASYPFAPVPFEFMTGELKYEAHYNQSGQLLKDIWHYPVYAQETIGTPGYICRNLNFSGVVNVYGGGPIFGTEYMLYSANKTQDQSVETDYDPNTGTQLSTTTTTAYGSTFHHKPTQKTVLSSKGENLVSNIKYAFDYRVAAADAIDDGYSTYTSSVSTAQSNYSASLASCSPQTCDANNCRSAAYGNFRLAKASARVSWVNWRLNNFNNSNSTFNNYWTSAQSNADGELKPIFELQSEFDNAAIETSNWRNGNLLNASFTRYDYVSNPSGFVYPQKVQTVNINAPSGTFTASATSSSGTSISKDSRYTDETYFNFIGGNLVGVTKKDGVQTSYIWGYNNVYPVAKVQGADFGTVNSLLNNSIVQNPSSDAQLRNELAKINQNLPNALAISYTYQPLVGMTSQTDAAGHNSYFEYDVLSRLKLIRDKDNNIVKQYDYKYQVNISAVPMSSITCSNIVAVTPYYISLTNVSTGQQYSFSFSSTGTIGQVPAGTYNVSLYSVNYSNNHLFIVNGYYQSGVSVATYSNVSFPSSGSSVAIY